MDHQRCPQCPAILPFSKISRHVELQHSVIENNKDFPHDDAGEEEMDFELNDDDEDVKEFLESTKSSSDLEAELEANNKDVRGNTENDKSEEEPRDACPLCESLQPAGDMTRHLADLHSVRVLSSTNWREDSVSQDDPFKMPDFLDDEKKEKSRLRCHHCQRGFNDDKKLSRHIDRRHGTSCKVCRVQKLLQQNRGGSHIKLLATSSKSSRSDSLALNSYSSIKSGKGHNIVYNYEEFFPQRQVRDCEQCETDFFWPTAQHSCSLVSRNLRSVSGRQVRGRMITGEMEASQDKDFIYMEAKLAQSLVRKHSREVQGNEMKEATENIQSLLREITDGVITGQKKELSSPDTDLLAKAEHLEVQVSAQILAYRYLLRRDSLPDLLLRATNFPHLFDGSLNEKRKLNDLMFREYKDDIENSRKEEFSKKLEEKKRMNREVLRDIKMSKSFDYSKYSIPNIRNNKPSKLAGGSDNVAVLNLPTTDNSKTQGLFIGESEKQQRTSPSMNGKSVSKDSSKTIGLLYNMAKQQQRTVKIRNVKPVPSVVASKGPRLLNNFAGKQHGTVKVLNEIPVPTANAFKSPRQLNSISKQQIRTVNELKGISVHSADPSKSPGLLSNLTKQQQRTVKLLNGNSVLKPQISRPSVGFTTPTITTGSSVSSVPTIFPPGLTVSRVSSEPVVTPPPPTPLAPLDRLLSLGLSVSVKGPARGPPPPPRTTIVKELVRRPPGPLSVPTGKEINVETRKIQKKIPTNAVKQISVRKHQIKSQVKISPELTHKKIPTKTFLPHQKFLLKLQILAYRFIQRGRSLPEVVSKAATTANFKEIKLSKLEQRYLKNFLSAEYKGL